MLSDDELQEGTTMNFRIRNTSIISAQTQSRLLVPAQGPVG
jgi:hypothetical protein